MISQTITESIYRFTSEIQKDLSFVNENIYNIENYTFTQSSLRDRPRKNTNYLRSYEVLNAAGRRENNLSVRDIPISSSHNEAIINGQSLQKTALTRTVNKNIIAVKFSAPGGKRTDSFQAMDVESSEYSSNNGLNNRNFEARFTQSLDLAKRTDPLIESFYTKHKINKNTRYLMNSSDAIYTKSDNGYISYQIPYHKDQTQWINNIYKNHNDRKFHYVFYHQQTGSELYFTNSTSEGLSEYFGNDYPSQLGYSSWQQIKSGKNWRYRKIKDNSFYYVDKKDSIQDGRGARVNPLFLIHTNTSNLDPFESTFLVKEPVLDYSQDYLQVIDENYEINKISYKSSFHNQLLNNVNGIEDNDEDNFFETVDRFEDKSKNIKKQIFPKAKDSSLLRTRSRLDYNYKYWRSIDYKLSEDGLTASLDFKHNKTLQQEDKYLPVYDPFTPGFVKDYSTFIWPTNCVPKTFFGNYLNLQGELASVVESITLIGGSYGLPEDNFAVNAFFCPVTGSNYQGGEQSILPFTSFIQAKSVPFYDTNQDFELDYIHKYKNYSTLPEYNITSKITLDNFENLKEELYNKSFDFYNTGSHLNYKSEKIKIKEKLSFNIDSVLKLRPYQNFYPVFNYLKTANIMSSSLAKDIINNSGSDSSIINYLYGGPIILSYYYISKIMSDFFSPGVLGNSIACGLPMSFCSLYSIDDPSSGQNPSFTASFESLFDPLTFLNGKPFKFSLGGSLYVTASLNLQVNLNYYKNIINNFMNEARFLFCKNNNLEYFSTKEEENFEIFEGGIKYVMNLSIESGKLDQTVDTKIGKNIIGGLSYIGNFGHRSFDGLLRGVNNDPCWNPNLKSKNEIAEGLLPCSNIRIIFEPTTTRKYTIDEIFANTNIYYSPNKNDGFEFTEMNYHNPEKSFNIFEKENNKWKIKSKWEFPYLIMTNSILEYNIPDYSLNNIKRARTVLNDAASNPVYVTGSYYGGLWYDYCEIPNENQGLFLKLSDHEVYYNSTNFILSASLADKIGFKKETKRIGELNDQKEISELICIVPVDVQDNSFFRLNSDTVLYKKNRKLFEKYIIPPKLDFTIDGISPSIMFCHEVKDIWQKKDLSYIWQNLLPQNGLSHKHISDIYEVDEQSILDALKEKEVYFMIFKCKLRSVTNPPGTYGVNWPYDEFSLIELVKIETITGN
jgi:hypothetical protein